MNKLFVVIVLAMFISSCASVSGLQDAKSIGENRTEITGALSLFKAPDLRGDSDGIIEDNIPVPFFPIAEVSGRYGITEKLDIGVKVNSVLNVGLHGKYQVVGDRDSKVALAVGGEVGMFGGISSLVNFQAPLFFSYHPSPKVSLYVNPRYIYQLETSTSVLGQGISANYLGGNAGVLFGTKHKFGIDVSYFGLGGGFSGTDATLFSIGIGGKFSFGGNDDDFDESPAPKSKKKTTNRKKRKS